MKAILGIVGGLLLLIVAFILIWVLSDTEERINDSPALVPESVIEYAFYEMEYDAA